MNLKVILILSLFVNSLFGFSYDIELTEKEIQNKIEKKFPYTKKKFLTKTILNNPEIKLKDGKDRIYLALEMTFSAGKVSFDGYAELSGKVFFDNRKKVFYFKNLEIEELVVDKIPTKFHSKIEKTVQVIAKVILNNYPIYKLKAKDFKHGITSLLLKDVIVKDQKLILTIGL